jgi:hypothetical protein
VAANDYVITTSTKPIEKGMQVGWQIHDSKAEKQKNTHCPFDGSLCAGLLSALCMWIFASLGGKLQSQKAAERFRGESDQRFAQVSCFFPTGEGIAVTDIYTFRQTLDTAFKESSLEPPENGSLYADAYSASAEFTVKGERGSATVPVVGIGGDYFLFHPLYLRSGGYIYDDDLMHDRVGWTRNWPGSFSAAWIWRV